MWVLTLILGMLLGHLTSQWVSYKSFTFRMVNQMAAAAVEHKGKRMLRWMCCKKTPQQIKSHHHHTPSPFPSLSQLLSILQTLSQENIREIVEPTVQPHHPPERNRTHTHPQSDESRDGTFHRKPLRKPSSHLLSEEK